LKQQPPAERTLREYFPSRVFVTGGVPTIKAVCDELAFKFHRILDTVGMATETVTGAVRFDLHCILIAEKERFLLIREFWMVKL